MRWLFAIADLALMCYFVAVGLEAAMQRTMRMASPFKLGEFHHAYLAQLFVIGGWALRSPTGLLLQVLGLVLVCDDLYQHIRQTLNGKTAYQSPLHQLYAKYLWPLKFVQRLTAFADRWWLAGVVLGLLALWLFT